MKIQYKTQVEKNDLVVEWVDKGYHLAEEQNHIDGTYLVFRPPTKYHTIDTGNKWIFDKKAWLDAEVRPERDIRLRASDYKMLIDVRSRLTVTELDAWKCYREQLRDLPQTILDISTPIEIVWPEEPIQ